MEGVTREELDAYFTHRLKSAGVPYRRHSMTNSRQALYQVTRGIFGKSISLFLSPLCDWGRAKASVVDEAILLDARRQGAAMSAATKKAPETTVLPIGATVRAAAGHAACGVGSNRACCQRKAFSFCVPRRASPRPLRAACSCINTVNSVKRYNLIGCVTINKAHRAIFFPRGDTQLAGPFSSQERKDFLSVCHEQPCAPPVSKMNGDAKSACKRCGHLRGHTIPHLTMCLSLVGRLLSPAPCDRVNVNTRSQNRQLIVR